MIATVADAITGPNGADAAFVDPSPGGHPQSNAPRPLCVLRHRREHPSIATGPSGRRTLLAHHAQRSELEGQVLWKQFQQIKERFPLVRPKLYLPYSELQAIAVL